MENFFRGLSKEQKMKNETQVKKTQVKSENQSEEMKIKVKNENQNEEMKYKVKKRSIYSFHSLLYFFLYYFIY